MEGHITVQKVGDELLLTTDTPDAKELHVVALAFPHGVRDLLDAVAAECGVSITMEPEEG